jgi:hypothetical protein
MYRSTSVGFNKYEVSDKTAQTARQWGDAHMYKTSYFKQSEKNVSYVECVITIFSL